MLSILIVILLTVIAIGVLLISEPGQDTLFFIVKWFLIGGACLALLSGFIFILLGDYDKEKIYTPIFSIGVIFALPLVYFLFEEFEERKIDWLEKALPVASVTIFLVLIYVLIKR